MNNQPIIFDLKYTPYATKKNASDYEQATHDEERAFYDMTGGENIFKYITTEGKRAGKRTLREYLEKNTGVFNQKGYIPQEEVEEMQERLKRNKGNVWHGFISFNEHDSPKIDTPEKCIRLVKNTFPSFFRDAGFNPANIDLMCALHLDRPKHLHIHFVFWEKEPKYKETDGKLGYRKKGKITETAIDKMFVRLGLFADDKREKLHRARDDAIKELRKTTCVKVAMHSEDEIRQKILSLSKDLPKTGRLSYGSKDMEPYRERVDKIVEMLLDYDKRARKANLKFHLELNKRKGAIDNICAIPHSFLEVNARIEESESPKYHHRIDVKNINIIDDIESDYKRRQGNLVLGLCKFIKPEYFERKKGKKYKQNDNKLKRALIISQRNIARRLDKFFSSFGEESELLERDFSHRLQDIEKETERRRSEEEKENLTDVKENYYDEKG